MAGKNANKWVFIGGGVLAAAALVVFFQNYPPEPKDAVGTVGAAQRYHSTQITGSDVKLDTTELTTWIQSDTFDRIVKDPAARALFTNAAVMEALKDGAVRDEARKLGLDSANKLNVDDARKLGLDSANKLNVDDARKLGLDSANKLNVDDARKLGLDSANKANLDSARKLDSALLQALKGNEALKNAILNNAALMNAIRNQAFMQAVKNDALMNALSNEARKKDAAATN